ncbi:GNAT family N-acetyltransferase [Zobellia roscoffensis]|uniref:GNAT family N-acetyltransferase n=1 Tax=Zobellia roscoffensis TaxID=2779508 RepID=UPI00188AEEED|nr:GNAT family N-acetyltransferase [Zobellia roscoffensis]
MTIEILHKFNLNDQVQQEIQDLYKQLNDKNKQRPLHQILQDDNHVVFAACKHEGHIIGIALLATYKVISGYRGLIEDVVVNSEHRGKGIGRKLMQKLLAEAEHLNLDEIILFSGHHRTAAIKLYKSLGFTTRESGVYNLKIADS